MALTLLFHPLSSFCHNVLIALYENDTSFTREILAPGDAQSDTRLRELWPLGKFPVLLDEAWGQTMPTHGCRFDSGIGASICM